MKTRLRLNDKSPAYKAVLDLEKAIQNSGLEKKFIHLIKLRASIINGCAFCVDMHVKEARASGLHEQWIHMVPVWRESPVFDAKERAVLAWTDTVTNIAQTGVPDAEFEGLREFFNDEEILNITAAIGAINTWNRLAVGFRLLHPIDPAAVAA